MRLQLYYESNYKLWGAAVVHNSNAGWNNCKESHESGYKQLYLYQKCWLASLKSEGSYTYKLKNAATI